MEWFKVVVLVGIYYHTTRKDLCGSGLVAGVFAVAVNKYLFFFLLFKPKK